MVSTTANFLSNFLSGMTSASKVSVSAMRRLIEHANPLITSLFDPEPPLFLPAALSLSDIRIFDANFAPTDGYCLLLITEGRGFLEFTKNTAQNITKDDTDHNNFDHYSLKKILSVFLSALEALASIPRKCTVEVLSILSLRIIYFLL